MIEDNDIGAPTARPAASDGRSPGTVTSAERDEVPPTSGPDDGAESGAPAGEAARGETGAADADRATIDGVGAGLMTLTFKLYATLQDLLPNNAVKNAVPIEVATDASLNDIIDRYRVPRELAHLVLVNGVFVCHADRDARGTLKAGDVLAIWPPVAGG